MTYSATLFDCKARAAGKEAAEKIFCATIEKELGSKSAVAAAYAAYTAAFEAHGELPLPTKASDTEREAVSKWECAESEACSAAFDGWSGDIRGAHFEIMI